MLDGLDKRIFVLEDISVSIEVLRRRSYASHPAHEA